MKLLHKMFCFLKRSSSILIQKKEKKGDQNGSTNLTEGKWEIKANWYLLIL